MVLQYDRTSVPLPPNLYLLNQNQKFMKRTLHLTVMTLLVMIASVNRAYGQEEERVVLYETDFSNGLEGWTSSPSEGWHYFPTLYYLSGSCSTYNTEQSSKLYRTINTNGQFYKDIEITCDMMNRILPNNGSYDKYVFVRGKIGEWKLHSTDSVFRDDIPRKDFQVGIGLSVWKTTSEYGAASIGVKVVHFKVTGIPFSQDNQPDYEISDMSEFQNTPEMSMVKINFTDATVLTRANGTVILQDKTKGGMVINDSTAKSYIVVNDEGAMGMPYVVTGSITGIHMKRNGSSELFCPSYDEIVLSENQNAQQYGRPIEPDDYYNHIGEFVSIPSVLDIDIWDRTQWAYSSVGWEYTEESRNSRNFKIEGVVFPYKDGGNPRLIYVPAGGSRIVFDEEYENDYERYYNTWAQIFRYLDKDKWYTLCLPYDMITTYNAGTYARFENSENGILSFRVETADTIFAGTPFMFKPAVNWTRPLNGIIAINSGNPVYETNGDYSFVGLLNPGEAESGSYYLTAGNTIKPFVPGSLMKAFHAYFVPNTPNAARARAISIDGMTTAIEDIEWGDGNPFLAPTDNRIYNLEGQMVGTNLELLPKGMYIINGKKVIK